MEIDNIDCTIDYSGPNTFFSWRKGKKDRVKIYIYPLFNLSSPAQQWALLLHFSEGKHQQMSKTPEKNLPSREMEMDHLVSAITFVKGIEMSEFGQI